jgi:hypothetical protein
VDRSRPWSRFYVVVSDFSSQKLAGRDLNPARVIFEKITRPAILIHFFQK